MMNIADLNDKSREELLDIHGFGDKTLKRLEEQLAQLGYTLKSEKEA